MSSAPDLSRRANDLKNRVRVLKNTTASGSLTPQQTINLVSLLYDTIDVLDQLLNKDTDVDIGGAKIVGRQYGKINQN